MSGEVATDLERACTVRIALRYFGIDVDLSVSPRDERDARWFYGAHERTGGSAAIRSYLYCESGFFRSLLAVDSATKRIAVVEGRGDAVESAFTDWSGAPSVVPPFGSALFRRDFMVLPGTTVINGAGTTALLVGANYSGKTSVALAMAKLGWSFISDSLTTIHTGTGLVQPLHGPVGFRRDTLARWSVILDELDTRSKISADTGLVVLTRMADVAPCSEQEAPINHVFRLRPTTGEDASRGVADWSPTAYPAGTARAARSSGILPTVAVDVPVRRSDDGVERAAAWIVSCIETAATRRGEISFARQ